MNSRFCEGHTGSTAGQTMEDGSGSEERQSSERKTKMKTLRYDIGMPVFPIRVSFSTVVEEIDSYAE